MTPCACDAHTCDLDALMNGQTSLTHVPPGSQACRKALGAGLTRS